MGPGQELGLWVAEGLWWGECGVRRDKPRVLGSVGMSWMEGSVGE